MDLRRSIHMTDDSLGIFPYLQNLGIKNAFTYDNAKWGNMSLVTNPRAIRKYERLFSLSGIQSKKFIYIRPDHNDANQVITKENLFIYSLFNNIQQHYSSLTMIPTHIDCIITKEKIPIVIAPADCLVIVLTAIDKTDGKRFIIFVHAGMSGAYLNVHRKAIKTAHEKYQFRISELNAFLFPAISERNYKKRIKNNDLLPYLDTSEWKQFIKRVGKHVSLAFVRKIEADLCKVGIKCLYSSGIDTYEAQKEGKLFSYTYQARRGVKRKKHFSVVISL